MAGKNRTMEIKHAKARKEAMREVLSRTYDFCQTSWARNANLNQWASRPAYAIKSRFY